MKLRVLDNSLRLRLDRSELRRLLDDGIIEGRTSFGGTGVLSYALHAVVQEDLVRAALSPYRIDIYANAARLGEWARSEEASLVAEQAADGDVLRLLFEKDFPCRHSGRRDAEEKFTPQTMRLEAAEVGAIAVAVRRQPDGAGGTQRRCT